MAPNYISACSTVSRLPIRMHFLTYAAKMLHTYDEAMNKLSSPKDTLRIGASESSDFIVFNELIKDYIAKISPM